MNSATASTTCSRRDSVGLLISVLSAINSERGRYRRDARGRRAGHQCGAEG